MSAIVVDTSVWVEFFRGRPLPRLERALGEGEVFLAPLVAAELASAPLGAPARQSLDGLLRDLPLIETPLDHWLRVGALRAAAARTGLTVSTPDAHVAQAAIDLGGAIWSNDAVFERLAARRLVTRFVP